MLITIISYSEKGMTRVMYAAQAMQNGIFRYVPRDGGNLLDRPYPGDLFDTAENARDHFVKLGDTVDIAPSQGGAIHPGLPG